MDYLVLFVFRLFEIICRLFVDYLSLDYLWIIRNMDYLRLFVFEIICRLFVLDYLHPKVSAQAKVSMCVAWCN